MQSSDSCEGVWNAEVILHKYPTAGMLLLTHLTKVPSKLSPDGWHAQYTCIHQQLSLHLVDDKLPVAHLLCTYLGQPLFIIVKHSNAW